MVLVILLLLLIGGVVALPLVLLARRRNTSQSTSPAEVVTYLILAVATLITVNSISSLVEGLMPGETIVFGTDSLALSLSTLIVAGVVAVALWIAMERNTGDQARPAREFYLAVVIAVAMAVVAGGAVRLLLWAVGADDFQPAAMGDLLAFGAAWWLHENFRRPAEEFDEIRQVAGSSIGLTLAAGGSFAILFVSLGAIVDSGQLLVGSDGLWEELRLGLVLLVVAAPYFWWFWLRGLARRPGAWRDGYSVLVAIGSWITAFTAVAVVANLVAQAIFGMNDGPLSRHFGSLPVSGATAFVAAVSYWHHRAVLGEVRNTPVRIVEYVLAAVGLVAGSGSLVTLAAVLADNMFGGGSIISSDSRLALGALVVLLLSAAVVWRYWVKALQLADDPAERMSVARRATVLILRVGFFLVGAGALVVVLFVLLRAALEDGESEIADSLNIAVPIVVVTGLMIWHLADQRTKLTPAESQSTNAQSTKAQSTETPQAEGQLAPGPSSGTDRLPVKLSLVTVVAADPGPLPKLIDGMRFLRRSDGIGIVDQERAEQIVAELGRVKSSAAVVTVDADSYSVIPVN